MKGSFMPKGVCEISLVCPVFNEEEVIEEFFHKVSSVLDKASLNYEIIFIDDGSRDRSFELLKKCFPKSSSKVKILRFSRNFGHQLAITAGLKVACGKAVVVMDSDLQDPPEIVLKFIEKWQAGYDIVYGIRSQRKGESFFKKFTAVLFYRLIRMATSIDIPENVGDFYLLDRKVVEVLNQMEERHRFLRGMVAWVGFKKIGIEYIREPRFAGKTKFGLWKMVKFSFDAATSFSFLPLRIIAITGTLISGMAFLGILVIIYQKLFTDTTITGWSSLMVLGLFMGGIQLLAIGLIGEYIARIGDDVKRRPLYIIKEFIES